MLLDRREVLTTLAIGSAAAMTTLHGGSLMAADQAPLVSAPNSAFAGKHTVVPLPFNPTKLRGISEKLITSHHDNNYAAAIKNLNRVETELAQVNKETPAFMVGGLKQSQLLFTNSIILHEHYFANLGGDGKPSGAIEKLLGQVYGSLARWEELFRATGQSLGGGSGWTVLYYDYHHGDIRTHAAINHSQALAFGQPLLVMDMYEHAYQMDYGAAAAKYIDAFFSNIHWDEVNRRLERGQKVAAMLRG